MTTPHHESLCRRCGRCCYEKVLVQGQVVSSGVPCEHLDEESRLCKVYDRRRELQRRCLTVGEGIEVSAFPADCPYVRDLPDYRAAISREEAAEQFGIDPDEIDRLAREE